jgi:hypothetical protein
LNFTEGVRKLVNHHARPTNGIILANAGPAVTVPLAWDTPAAMRSVSSVAALPMSDLAAGDVGLSAVECDRLLWAEPPVQVVSRDHFSAPANREAALDPPLVPMYFSSTGANLLIIEGDRPNDWKEPASEPKGSQQQRWEQ